MIRKLFSIFFIVFVSTNAFTQEYLKHKAKPGDASIRLMTKYQLSDQPCNFIEFCHINKLNKDSYLIKDKDYLLPIKVWKFDGISIRSSMGLEDYEQAKKIEEYNDLLLKKKVKKGDFRTSTIWVPLHLINCGNSPGEVPEKITPILNDADSTIKKGQKFFAIFGKEEGWVTFKTDKLKGKIFYLVSGHGGPDPGAVGSYLGKEICEDEYAYDITLRFAKNLLEQGATVYIIIRDKDGIRSDAILPCDKTETCWKEKTIPRNQILRLRQRAEIVNALYAQNKSKTTQQELIVLHVDSRASKKRVDMFFYHHAKSKKGKKLAQSMYKTVKQKYQEFQKGRGYTGTIQTRNLYMINESDPPTAYIELGNIQNSNDQKRFVIESNRQAVADWLAEGVLRAHR